MTQSCCLLLSRAWLTKYYENHTVSGGDSTWRRLFSLFRIICNVQQLIFFQHNMLNAPGVFTNGAEVEQMEENLAFQNKTVSESKIYLFFRFCAAWYQMTHGAAAQWLGTTASPHHETTHTRHSVNTDCFIIR